MTHTSRHCKNIGRGYLLCEHWFRLRSSHLQLVQILDAVELSSSVGWPVFYLIFVFLCMSVEQKADLVTEASAFKQPPLITSFYSETHPDIP